MDIIEFLSTVLTSAAVAGALLWFLRDWLSERLKNAIKHEYDVQLESHKAVLKAEADAENEKLRSSLSITAAHELEQLRFKISALLDRTTKLHQREFEVLPEAWAKLNEAYWTTRQVVSPLQSYPDIDRMPPRQQAEFIASLDFPEWVKDELRGSSEKNKIYQSKILWHRLDGAKSKARDAYTFSIKSGIFVTEDIRNKFAVLHGVLWDALVEHEINEEHSGSNFPRERKAFDRLRLEGDALLKELE